MNIDTMKKWGPINPFLEQEVVLDGALVRLSWFWKKIHWIFDN